MSEPDCTAFDAPATLREVADARAAADQAEVRILRGAAHWATLHGQVDDIGPGRSLPGMERLVRLGGEGTPEVAEFAPAEFGAVLAMSAYSASVLIGDALDLQHRLPRLWRRVRAGEVKPWVGRKVAQATRQLSSAVAADVDRRVSRWAHSVSWGRLEAIIGAAVIEADPDGAAAAVEAAETAVGVWVRPSNDHGIKDIHIRAEAPDAIWFDAAVDRAADGLGLLGDTRSKDARRAHAIGILAQPQQALDLFAQAAACASGSADTAGAGSAATRVRRAGDPVDSRPPATLYIHLSEESLRCGEGGAARVEGVGPVTGDQVRRWLGHCNVTVKPVIDLAGQAPVDGYEVPDRLREAVHLRSPVDVFPYATNVGRHKDVDHTDPYRPVDEGGPPRRAGPGPEPAPPQTRLDNLAPMTRFHHRVKTHGRWRVAQVFDGVFVWRSPHGYLFLVDRTGTRPVGLVA